ncbi:MAG: DUF3108 domain-containing protein [Gemmatimonadota bacterium]
MKHSSLLAAALLGAPVLLGTSAVAPTRGTAVSREARAVAPPAYPFSVGESFAYSAKLGVLNLGSASMAVTGIDTVRGAEVFRFRFGLEGGTIFFKINSVMESWTGTSDFISRRFHQDSDENGRVYKRYYEIYPDSGIFRQENKPGSHETPSDALDDAAFFYFIRTTALEVGKSYDYPRYFRKELNPVRVSVLKEESLELPGGQKVNCLVVQPVVGDQGIFAPRADARLWLTNDARRIPVQIRSKLPFGTITLRLTEMKLPDHPAAGT